ncbi:GAF and ANTAR domain-containing protein [Nocardia iowensis]|uniref:GAF and ANTAR domain-containing protein n=1 Tax=Nocardia iowensis TaxID=204891 RepID=A0ABX8RVA0_NOCIO|nr:GAF and ANTAR domain-containing protein [Nocardia iowensis]QXN92922.1 GAF and ANTAR domain-containing protein [Nocardia iowensis]
MPEQTSTSDELATGMAELTALLLSTNDIGAALHALTEIVSRMLPGRPMVGVTMRLAGEPATVAATGTEVIVVDEAQYDQRHGPCLTAMDTAQPVSVPALTHEQRWGDYPARVLAHGIHAIYAQPLLAEGKPVGALNLYARMPNAFDERSQRAINLTAEHTGVLLTAVFAATRQADLTDQLRAALASRTVIDQALGILMGQQRCDRDAAFDLLRKASQRRNMKIIDLARATIRTMTGAEPPERPHFKDPSRITR